MSILDITKSYAEPLTAIRRDIHAHPELGMEEFRTAELVATYLTDLGIEVHRNIGNTGVVGVIRKGNGARSIGLRCDMDALPIHEMTGLDYASTNKGVMHACGHDGHTTMQLGAARYLVEHGNFDGTVNLIFQPAEEGRGGALAMLKDGLFERFPCDAVFGMHNWVGMPVGQAAIGPGAQMAGGGFFDITITGRGAHGARPEDSVDPVPVAAAITQALQTIVSRNVHPSDTAVVSVTWVEAGAAYNVIPEKAVLRGTARAFQDGTIKLIEQRMKALCSGIAESFGARAEVDFRYLFAPTVNDAEQTAAYADAVAHVLGEDNLNRHGAPVMGSEDFSWMLQAKPGAYLFVGNGSSAPVHNDRYNFNDALLPIGAAILAQLVEEKLAVSEL